MLRLIKRVVFQMMNWNESEWVFETIDNSKISETICQSRIWPDSVDTNVHFERLCVDIQYIVLLWFIHVKAQFLKSRHVKFLEMS